MHNENELNSGGESQSDFDATVTMINRYIEQSPVRHKPYEISRSI